MSCGIEISMHVVAAVSCLSSFSVLIVYLSCKEINKKSYNTIISFVCLCDLFSCMGGGIGLSRDGTVACWIQGDYHLMNLYS